MTSPHHHHDEFEAQLRQLLTAEADSVQPSPEALNLIRERTEKGRAASWLGLPWLRPAIAVAGAVLVAGSVIMSSPQVRDQVLEFVPAGANQDDTPSVDGEGTDNNGGIAAPDTSTDSVDGTTQAESEPAEEPEPTPSPKERPTDSEDEEVETTASCPPRDGDDPGPTPTDGEDEESDHREGRGCGPTDEPSEPEESEEPDPGDDEGEEPDDSDSTEPPNEDDSVSIS